MGDAVAVVVDFRVQGAGSGVITGQIALISQAAERAARDSSSAFNRHFGANFFADLASRAVDGFRNILSGIVSAAVDAAQRAEAAFKGLRATASNLGISPADAEAAVRNLDLVRNGLLTVGDASASLKNLLATGFGLPEAIDIIRAFGDTAAFGRQSALTYGEAIRSATEGIKNQNSILVDNAGLTKNLSVILKERGFIIQDLSDETKKASALQALHNGLLKEAAVQAGDAAQLLNTYQGAVAQAQTSQTRFLATLGETITKSTAVRTVLQGYIAVLDFLGEHIEVVKGLATAIGLLTLAMITYNAQALLAQIPLLASVVKGVKDVIFWMVHFRTALLETQVALAATGGWLALIGVAVSLGIALAELTSAEEHLEDISQGRIDSIIKERAALEAQADRLSLLTGATEQTAKAQSDLKTIYEGLNIESQARIGNISGEESAAQRLQNEIRNLIRLRTEELELIARVNTAQLIGKIQEIRQSEQRAQDLRDRIRELSEQEARLNAQGFGGRGLSDEEAGRLRVGRQSEIGRQGQLAQLRENNLSAQREAYNLAEATKKAREEADGLLVKQGALGGALRRTSDELVDNAAKFGNVSGAVDHGKKLINDYKSEHDLLNPSIEKNISALDRFTSALDEVNNATEKQIGDRRKRIQALVNVAAETAAQMDSPTRAGELAKGLLDFDLTGQIRRDIAVERAYRTARESVEKALGLNRERKPREQLSEIEQLQRKINELEKDLSGFLDLTSREFTLRFKQEGLERQIRDLERILDLRRELGVELSTPLPDELRDAIRQGNDVEAARLARQISEELQIQLDRRNAIKKLLDATRDTEEEILRAQMALGVEVVSAQDRAQLKYLQNLRERKDAEAQLTADLTIQIRRRAEAEQNAARDLQRIQAEVYGERLKRDEDVREALLRAVSRARIASQSDPNEAFRGNVLIGTARDVAGALSQNPVVIEIGKGNTILRSIEENTRSLNPQKTAQASAGAAQGFADVGTWAINGLRSMFGVGAPAADPVNLDALINRASPDTLRRGIAGLKDLTAGIDERRRQDAREQAASVRDRSRLRQFDQDVKAVAGRFPDELNTEQMIAATEELNRQTERRTALVQEAARIEIEGRASNIRLLNEQTIAEDRNAERRELEIVGVNRLARAQRLLNELRDPASQAHALELQRQRQALVDRDIEQEKELIRLREQRSRGLLSDPDFVARARRDAEISREQAAEQRARQIIELEDAVAHAGEDAADRYRIAWLSAIREVQDADVRANEDIIRAREQLKDSTVLHTDQVRAIVARHLADQKTITQTTGEAIVKIYDRIAGKLDETIDRATSKLGFVGELIGDFAKTYGRQLLNNVFGNIIGINNTPAGAVVAGSDRQTQTMNVSAGVVHIGGGVVAGAPSGGGVLPSILPGGSSGGGIGGLLGLLLGGGGSRAAGTPPFIAGGSFTVPGGSPFSGGLFDNDPTFAQRTAQGQQAGGGLFSNLGTNVRQFFGQNLGGGQFGGLFAQGSFGFGNSAFAGALPLLGLSLGSQLGGGGLGSVLGGAGGLLASIGLISPGAVGLSATSFLAPLFSNPITAIIGGALLVGGIIYGRNRQRRRDEETRDQLTRDSRGQLQELLKKVQTDQLDGESALAQAAQIRENYLSAASQLKDKKAREHALLTVRELDYDIARIREAVEAQNRRKEFQEKLIPTFAEGGMYRVPRGISMSGYSSGLVGHRLTHGGADEYLGAFREGEVFLTAEHVSALGGAPAMRRAGVRGFDSGGAPSVSPSPTPAHVAASGRPITVVPVIVFTEDEANKMLAMSSPDLIAFRVMGSSSARQTVSNAVGAEIFRRQ